MLRIWLLPVQFLSGGSIGNTVLHVVKRLFVQKSAGIDPIFSEIRLAALLTVLILGA